MGWSGISAYLIPANKNVESIFTPVQNDLILLASMAGFYYPAQQVNTLGEWNSNSGFKVKAQSDFDLTLTGTKITDLSLDLFQGWNLIPVITPCDVAVDELFADFEELVIVKEVAGVNLYWPAYNINTLGNLHPGKSYFAAVGDAGTLTFSDCNNKYLKQVSELKPINNSPWNDLNYTAASHTIAFPSKALSKTGLQAGDIIGAFDGNGLCCGRTEPTFPYENTALTVFGNDEISNIKDGFSYGEPFYLKAYRPETDQEFLLEVSYEPALPNMGYFADQGLSAIKTIELKPLNVNELSQRYFDVYPNPSHGQFNLIMNFQVQQMQILIIDIQGSIVKVLKHNVQNQGEIIHINLGGIPNGVYFLKLYGEGFVGMKKVVID